MERGKRVTRAHTHAAHTHTHTVTTVKLVLSVRHFSLYAIIGRCCDLKPPNLLFSTTKTAFRVFAFGVLAAFR